MPGCAQTDEVGENKSELAQRLNDELQFPTNGPGDTRELEYQLSYICVSKFTAACKMALLMFTFVSFYCDSSSYLLPGSPGCVGYYPSFD